MLYHNGKVYSGILETQVMRVHNWASDTAFIPYLTFFFSRKISECPWKRYKGDDTARWRVAAKFSINYSTSSMLWNFKSVNITKTKLYHLYLCIIFWKIIPFFSFVLAPFWVDASFSSSSDNSIWFSAACSELKEDSDKNQ